MKRFWKEATIVPVEGGWGLWLDGKTVRTPATTPLLVPTEALAEAIAAEWNGCGERVDPRAMPLTGLANAAIDKVASDPEQFSAGLAKYGESDLACYRAETPRELVARQEDSWGPILGWGRARYDIDFRITSGIVHVAQPEATVERLSAAVSSLDPFRLAALSPLVTIGGSLVIALAVLEREISPEQAWDAVTVDDCWQREQWGDDPEARSALEARKCDFLAAARFLDLLSD